MHVVIMKQTEPQNYFSILFWDVPALTNILRRILNKRIDFLDQFTASFKISTLALNKLIEGMGRDWQLLL